jgi:hypothetical protein
LHFPDFGPHGDTGNRLFETISLKLLKKVSQRDGAHAMIRVTHLDYGAIKETDNSMVTKAGRLVGYRMPFMQGLFAFDNWDRGFDSGPFPKL